MEAHNEGKCLGSEVFTFRSIVMSKKLMVSTPQYKIDVKSYITQMLSDGSV